MTVENIIFDLGGVLIDWNRRYLYRKIFASENEVENFINNIFPFSYNHKADAGESLFDICEELSQKHPEFREAIFAYAQRWEETLGGEISENVEIMQKLRKNYRVLALTNWSHETFPIAKQRFDFLKDFEGIVVSGEEGVAKPDKEIFEILLKRFNLDPHYSLFIDDNIENVKAAEDLGIRSVHLADRTTLAKQLTEQLGENYGSVE